VAVIYVPIYRIHPFHWPLARSVANIVGAAADRLTSLLIGPLSGLSRNLDDTGPPAEFAALIIMSFLVRSSPEGGFVHQK
jgi:hypothetical protein